MRKWPFVMLLCMLAGSAFSQLEITHDSFKVNNLGQVITISSRGLDMYNAQGKRLKHFSEQLLSEMSTIDRSSSLESLVFYSGIPGFQLLDNTLSPHAPLYDLNQAGLQNISSVCISNDNSFWAYDAVDFEIIRFNDNYDIVERSGNLVTIIGGEIAPVAMMISNNRLYVADPDKGLLVFDLFANYLMTIPFEGKILDMDVTENFTYVLTDTGLYRTDKKGIYIEKWNKSLPFIRCIDVELGMVYWGDGKRIAKEAVNSLFD